MSDRTVSLQRGGTARVWSSPDDPDVLLLSVDCPITAFTPDETHLFRDAIVSHLAEFYDRQPPTVADLPDQEWP